MTNANVDARVSATTDTSAPESGSVRQSSGSGIDGYAGFVSQWLVAAMQMPRHAWPTHVSRGPRTRST